MKILSLIAITGALTASPLAQAEEHSSRVDLSRPIVEEIPLSVSDYNLIQEQQHATQASQPSSDSLDELDVKIDKVISIGKKIWKIIEANKPVVGVNTTRVSALPEGITKWSQLEGWSAPAFTKYRITYKDFWGIEVIRIEYVVSYSYGGSFNGKGNYLSQVGYTITNLDVSWGFTVNAYSEVVRVENAGTSNDPIASLETVFHWEVKTVAQEKRSAQGHMIMGTGEMSEY